MENGEVAYFLNILSITTTTQKRQKAQCCQDFLQTTLHQSFVRGEQVHKTLIVKHKKKYGFVFAATTISLAMHPNC
jgi:hypothetical protein